MKLPFLAHIADDDEYYDGANVVVYADAIEDAVETLNDYRYTVLSITEFDTFSHGDPRDYIEVEF